MESFYQRDKGFLNSLYGMCVTSLIPDSCEVSGDDWIIKTPSDSEIIERLKHLGNTKSYNHDYFTQFSTGVFCTAYARKNLFKCALGMDDAGNYHDGLDHGWSCVYFDTDSIFALGVPDFSWYNEEITNKLKECCKARKLDFTKTQPQDRKGIIHPLGLFDREDDIKTFRCNHAKMYLEEHFDGSLAMTISGINKGAVKLLGNDPFNAFSDGFVFDKDSEYVKKLLPTYNFDQTPCTFPDGYQMKYKHGKNLRRTGYKISLTDEYQDLLRAYEITIDDLDESQIIAFMKEV